MPNKAPHITKPELEHRIAHTERMIADVDAFMKHLMESRSRPRRVRAAPAGAADQVERKLAELEGLRDGRT